MTQLIQDVFIIENLQVLSEGKGNGKTVVKGIFGRCNETNKNGRMYPTAVLEGQLKKVQPLINERRLCGELDHPSNDTVKLANASHLITKLEMKGDELIGEAEILGTPAGLTAKALIEAGVCIGISSRGMGTLSEDANGNKVVNDDFRLVTFDLVADPSTRGAFPALAESTESRFARTSQSKLKKEQNFVTMLQEKLRESYDPWIEEAKKGKKKKKAKKKKGSFPDLTGDGKVTRADILKGRGVFEGMEAVKAEGSWHQIAYTLAEGLGLVEAFKRPKTRKEFSKMAVRAMKQQSLNVRSDPNNPRNKSPMEQGEQIRKVRTRLGLDHTVYQDIGMALAEGLGIVEGVDDANTAGGGSSGNSTSTSTTNLKAQTDAAKARTAAAKAERAATKERRKEKGQGLGSVVSRTAGNAAEVLTSPINRAGQRVRSGERRAAIKQASKEAQIKTAETEKRKRKASDEKYNTGAHLARNARFARDNNHPGTEKEESTVYKQIGFALAEALGLIEMNDKSFEDQRATVGRARLAAFQDAHRGGGRRSKSEIMRAATKRENQINRRQRAAQDDLPEKIKSRVKRPRKTDQGGEDRLSGMRT